MDWKKLQNIDRRIIYILLILATVIPMINPIGIPVSVGASAQKFYNFMDAIPAGDKVLFSMDFAASGAPDILPEAKAVMQHLMDKGVKVVSIAFWDNGPMFADQLMKTYEDQGFEYGVDFANLGYIPGGETAIKRFGEDVVGSVSKDFRNNSISSLPIMEGIKDTRDFAAVIDFAAGNPGTEEWIRQVQGTLGINFFVACATVSVPQAMPFVNSGQVTALLGGMRGAAEYETAMGKPGGAVAKMDAQSLGHLLIIAFIAIGNIAFFMDKKQAR